MDKLTFADLEIGAKFYLAADKTKQVLRTKITKDLYAFTCINGKVETVFPKPDFECELAN